jgi:glycosyltransferase involved in cell wall biosynthesis
MLTSIVIPVIPKMFDDMIEKLFPTIIKQTKLPDEIVVAMSQCTKSNVHEYNKRIRNALRNSTIQYQFLPSEKLVFAGGNRTRGSFAARGEFILFVDADDYMQNQRVQIISHIFNTQKANAILHKYHLRAPPKDTNYTLLEINRFFNSEKFVPPEKMYQHYQKSISDNDHDPHSYPFVDQIFHMGHLCIRKKVLNFDMFDPTARRGQDSCFVRDLFKTWGGSPEGICAINLPLTSYYPNPKPPERTLGVLVSPRPWEYKSKRKNRAGLFASLFG